MISVRAELPRRARLHRPADAQREQQRDQHDATTVTTRGYSSGTRTAAMNGSTHQRQRADRDAFEHLLGADARSAARRSAR